MVKLSSNSTHVSASAKRDSLTTRQKEIYDFLADKINNRGYGPTVREIGEEFNIKSPNGVMCHLKALERKGLIRRESNMSRAICLTDSQQHGSSMRLLGQASAATPLRQDSQGTASVDFGSLFDSSDSACIQIEGSHYMALGINHGDFIVVHQQETAEDSMMMATLDDHNSLVLARKDAFGGQLIPVIAGRHSAPPRDILGTVTGVIRQLAAPSTANRSEAMAT